MIIEKAQSPHDDSDAPPSYEDINLVPGLLPIPIHQKTSPQPTPSSSSNSDVQQPTVPKQKRKARSGWFDGFGVSRAAKEAKSEVYRRLRDMAEQPMADSLVLLEACAAICDVHGLSFSSILQDPFMWSHMPIYWAIIKLPSRDDMRLVVAILTYSAPLMPQTLSEIRLASLHVGDQKLFQTLWGFPQLTTALSGPDQVLLGASATPDTVEVQVLPGDGGAFAAHFWITHFERRMKVSGQISLEFIARGRMWRIRFHTITEQEASNRKRLGTWAVSLSILEHSPPTWIDSRLVIRDSPGCQSSTSSPPAPTNLLRDGSTAISTFINSISGLSTESPFTGPRSKSSLFVRLKTGHEQLIPMKSDRGKKREKRNELTALFDESPLGQNLFYPDSSFYGPDGMLDATLEARLTKPDGECIIC